MSLQGTGGRNSPSCDSVLHGRLLGIVESAGNGARGAGDRAPRRIAVYGEIDPNLVDGSSVWLQSVCQVLASIDGVEVTLLLRRPLQPERRFLLDALAATDGVEIVDPGEGSALGAAETPGGARRLLQSASALDLLEKLDRERGPFDRVLLRGQALLTAAAADRRFDGRLWPYAMTGRGMADETLRALAARSDRVLCQTEAVAEELREIAPEAGRRLLVLPPMIPDVGPPPARNGRRDQLRLVYSGKLAPEYCWLETVDAFTRLRESEPTAELHVLGDKVHRPPDQPEFHERATRALRETEGLRWHGAVPREAVHGLLADCDLALSIRDPGVEAAREISTKVLEYGAAGLPVVLNRASAYERLLGEDYPFFVDGPQSAAELLVGPVLDPEARAAAAAACHGASGEFTFSRVGARLAEHLPAASAAPPAPARADARPSSSPAADPSAVSAAKQSPLRTFSVPEHGKTTLRRDSNGAAPATRVLIAGHDLKFTGPIREAIASTGATVIEDVWKNHTEHDEAASRAALDQADVILCEWCLGNAAWYSRNKRPDQRLVIRLHRVEAYTDHPAAVEINHVDKVVCVSQHIADDVIERFGWDQAKFQIIPNSIDVDRFRLPKHDRARHTLAMVGYVPKRKRLDRALDIIEKLRCQEPRFRLLLVGHPPSELEWVARKSEEVEFFRHCYSRIQGNDELRGGVTFLPFSKDLPSLFQQAGFVLSTSDSEGHQVALAEGAASGAAPVVLDRPGANMQYPPQWVHKCADHAAAWIVGPPHDLQAESAKSAKHALCWSATQIRPNWCDLLHAWPDKVRSVGA
jgi:glycosyltransferase involved in cell wall biosynthesis